MLNNFKDKTLTEIIALLEYRNLDIDKNNFDELIQHGLVCCRKELVVGTMNDKEKEYLNYLSDAAPYIPAVNGKVLRRSVR